MIYFDDHQVESLILKDPSKYLSYLYDRMIEIANGQKVWVQPKIIYPDPIHPTCGDVRPMTCFTDRVKIVKIVSTNPIRIKDPRVTVGSLLSLDYDENYPHAIYDASNLSSIRTAALAHLIIKIMGYNYDKIFLIGLGEVGHYFLDLSPSLKGIKTYDKKLSWNPPKFEGEVVVSATTSFKPFLNLYNCSCDLLISLGSDTSFNFEITTTFLTSRKSIYVDTYDAFNVGDLSKINYPQGAVDGDIFDLIKNKNCDTFISVGNPLMDALTVEYLEEKTEPNKSYTKGI